LEISILFIYNIFGYFNSYDKIWEKIKIREKQTFKKERKSILKFGIKIFTQKYLLLKKF